jgi:hypothetical protein
VVIVEDRVALRVVQVLGQDENEKVG